MKKEVKNKKKGGSKVIVELGIGVFSIGAASYALWKVRRQKAVLRKEQSSISK